MCLMCTKLFFIYVAVNSARKTYTMAEDPTLIDLLPDKQNRFTSAFNPYLLVTFLVEEHNLQIPNSDRYYFL